MALDKHARKELLGLGGLTRIARKTRRSIGHVSQVNDESRRDPKVERAIIRAITRKHPIPVDQVFSFPDASHPTAPAVLVSQDS